MRALASILLLALSPAHALTNLKSDWDAYTSALVIPDVIDMTSGGDIDMQIGRASHNWTEDGSVSGDIYGYALKNSTPTFPGPTIKVARGVPISVTWYNELLTPHLLDDYVESSIAIAESHCYPYCGVPTVVHVHGLESPAKYDGLPLRTIYNNQSQKFVYLNNQSASTKLYHDHANGLTRLNAWAGLMGIYVIQDTDREVGINVDVETDIPIMIADRLINDTGALMYSDDNCQTGITRWVPESYGSVNTVNGVVMPYVNVPSAQVRLRITNGANARHYNLTVPFADQCKLIAKDSGFVQVPEDVPTHLTVYPFERVELFCDFSSDTDGTTYDIVDIPTVAVTTTYDPRVMQFRVSAELKTDTMTTRTLPSTLIQRKDLKKLYQELGGKNRSIILGEMDVSTNCPIKNLIRYRGMEINSTTIKNTLDCTKGKVEKWHFQNPTDDPHPFHWHVVNAQCGASDDEVDTNALKDVVVIPNAGSSRASTTVTQICYVACTPDEFLVEGSERGATEYNFDTSEPYVAHCHILEHEENNMLSLFQLTDGDDDAPNDDGSTSTTNEITTAVILSAMGMSVLGAIATSMSILVISVDKLMFLGNPRSLSVAFALSAGVMIFIAFADLWMEAVTYYKAAFTTGGNADPEAYETGATSASTGTCGNTCQGNAWLATMGAFLFGMACILPVEYIVHMTVEKKGSYWDQQNEKEDEVAVASVNTSPCVMESRREMNLLETGSDDEAKLLAVAQNQKEQYRRAGMMTGIAIAIHNFPEGLALFVSSLQGMETGIILSIGIILHNLPEGVAIAAPVYYATGSKLQAFKWTAISGVAQPLGAAVGWAAVSGGMSYALQASLYAVVAGMLVCIAAKELLPGAYRFDPKGKYFVLSFFVGISIIASSLVLIHYAGSG
ncbi:Zinc (Zn2)-Iron (Fe2) Permease [Phytophthora cinnamomi]|uniref:Zinc (Zn2)-Iron (Fe2) Permease n=1 Tax=Phytophthora cinnamomi TaxID=4785 RepID=UPI003559B27B|nr:Zinc (Zn2)-Iron (Fe2) Permease [Phytophthora cinnamomi]